MLSKEVSSTIFKDFSMTRPGIEPRSTGSLANTLPTSPMREYIDDQIQSVVLYIYIYIYIYLCVYVRVCYLFLTMCVCVCLWVYVFISIYFSFTCVCVCMCGCVYAYTGKHVSILRHKYTREVCLVPGFVSMNVQRKLIVRWDLWSM